MTTETIHEFVPPKLDDDAITSADLENRVFIVRDWESGLPSRFNDGTYTQIMIELDGEPRIWRTQATAIPDQLKDQELPFRAMLKKQKSKTGVDYWTLAPPPSEGEENAPPSSEAEDDIPF